MPDIAGQLRIAMHAAVDGVEASPDHLIRQVKRMRRRATARRTAAAVVAALAIVVSIGIVLNTEVSGSGSSPVSPQGGPPAGVATRMSGLPLPAGMNVEFLITTPNGAGWGASWYSTATQRTESITGLPAIAGGYQYERLDGGWAASPLTTHYSPACPVNECAGPPATFYFIANGSTAAMRVGQAYSQDGVDPGSHAGTLWLVTYPRSSAKLSGASFAQLVTTAGHPLGPRYRLPANTLMGRGIGRYLLLDIDSDNETHFELWDPATGRVLGHFDNVVAQGPEQVVWTNGCQSCRLEVTNVTTGKTVITSIPGANPAKLSTALTDDGRLLAAQVPGREIDVVNTETGAMTAIAGTALSTADFEYFDWQNAGHRLIVAAGPSNAPGPDQIAYWQPGETRLHVATISNTNELAEIETGSF